MNTARSLEKSPKAHTSSRLQNGKVPPLNPETRLTLLYALSLCVLAVVYRLLPRYVFDQQTNFLWNLMPIGALGLFVGSRIRSRLAYLLPLLTMFLADLLLVPAVAAAGFNSFYVGTPFIYAAFVLYAMIGRIIPETKFSIGRISGAALLGGLQFFVLTNLVSWLTDPNYAKDLGGLISCYIHGIPFYRNTLLSDSLFTSIFFGTQALILWTLHPQKETVPA